MPPSTLTITTATQPGSSHVPSQDRVFHAPGLAVVVGGATTTAPGAPALGSLYADALGDELLTIAGDRGMDLQRCLAAAITRTAQRLGLAPETIPGVTPQAAVAIGRETDGWWEAAVIGNCTVAGIRYHSAPVVLTDDRLAAIIRTLPDRIEQQSRLTSGAGRIGDEADQQLTRQIATALSALANREGGYWTAAGNPQAGLHARTARWPLDELRDVLLMTDGASRTVDLYKCLSWDEMAQLCRLAGPAAVLDLAERADLADSCGRRYPRATISDDATLAHVLVPMGAAW